MQCQAILVHYGHFVASQIVQITFEFLTGLCRLGAVSLFVLVLRAKRVTHENDHRYSRLSRARALPSLNLKIKGRLSD